MKILPFSFRNGKTITFLSYPLNHRTFFKLKENIIKYFHLTNTIAMLLLLGGIETNLLI